MLSAFEVVAEPNRRRILDLLREGRRPVGELVDRLGLAQPTVSKHLRVLKDARLVDVEQDAQRRLYRLRPEPLVELDDWLTPYRELWSRRLDALERHLDTMADEPPATPPPEPGPKEEAMKHGTLTPRGDRVELRFERRLSHPPEKVWRALTDSKELAHWFPARIEGARETGAELRFFFEEGAPGTGRISVFDPPRVLEYTWEGDVLRWELRPEGTGCLLVFTSIPGDRANVARDATGWHFCLDNLEASIDGNPAAGFDKERFSALNAEYAARFGLGSFPAFMTGPSNRVAASSLNIPGVEAYVFDGADGTQLTLCHARSDADTGEQWKELDEYLAVLEGSYVLRINGLDIQLGAGREFVIPRGARISGRFTAGTRTLHVFSGRGLKRAEAQS